MKALTLTQPYATLVAIGAKRIETRSWATSYRGPLAIHAGAGLGPVGGKGGLWELCTRPPFSTVLLNSLPLGAVVAMARLVDCCPMACWYEQWSGEPDTLEIGYIRHGLRVAVDDRERAFGDYSPGRYAWLLADVRPLAEPIPAKGALGLWEWEPQERAAAPSE